MAEEDFSSIATGSDDVSVLRELLHTIRGLSPVSTSYALAEIEAEEE